MKFLYISKMGKRNIVVFCSSLEILTSQLHQWAVNQKNSKFWVENRFCRSRYVTASWDTCL